jgi:hypothetical protein
MASLVRFGTTVVALAVALAIPATAQAGHVQFGCGGLQPGETCAYGPVNVTSGELRLDATYAGSSPQLGVCADVALNSSFAPDYAGDFGVSFGGNVVTLWVFANHNYYLRVGNCGSTAHTVTGEAWW